MSPVYLNPPPTSPIHFIELKGDLSANNFSYTSLDHHEGLAIEYSWNHQDKVDKVLSYDHKSNDGGQESQSSPWPQNYIMNGTESSHAYSSSPNGKIKIVTKNEEKNSKKWKPSKVRIMQKMMTTPKNIEQRRYQSNIYNNNNNGVRVCVDCHTTTTPLWRSGPQGPKTLCNACGIRQRKARRAAMAAAAVAMELAPKKPKVDDEQVIREKHYTLPLKKRGKITFEDAISTTPMNWNNNIKSQRPFPRDEEEGAILLMALSCGLACSS